ncbi:MAG TPA: preprotein translocase subunit YajC [Gammaproteobacteria bacterium]|nr:preprotein translocase subunit YajC [Gammaproteobacteria bacterium]
MSFFISNAWAEGPADAVSAGPASFIPLIVIFIIFYFLLIRPQSKRAKEQKNMIAALAKGDEIATSGGMLGKIIEIDDNFMTIEIARDTQVQVQRNAVSTLLPKGTIKGA